MSHSVVFTFILELFLCTPVILMIYYRDISEKSDLASAREGFTKREKLNMDMTIYALSFLFCSALSVNLYDQNPLYVVPLYFLSGILITYIVNEYVKLHDLIECMGGNLRRNIGLSRTLDSLQQSHTFLLRENEFLQQELSRYTPLSTITIPRASPQDISAREKISSIQDAIFDLKEKIPDGPYVELMNKTREIFQQIPS